ncbi:MAG TPA: hypothetical protein VF171_02690, partial [Trueperaceae bacterium]
MRESVLPKIEAAVARGPGDELWQRPHEAFNRLGNLLLHVPDSTRDWIVIVVGRMPSDRIRAQEFTSRTGPSKR